MIMHTIVFHELVTRKDFAKINLTDRQRIVAVIEKKLIFNPEIFGKPLQGKLKGCFRLRIDPYRIVYTINKNQVTVFIIKIGLRKDLIVYIEAAKRLGLVG